MNIINLKQIKKDYTVTLHKVNRDILAEIPGQCLVSLKRSIDSIDELCIEVSDKILDKKDYSLKNNPIYDLLKKERLLCLDNSEYFVIKDIETSIENKREIKNITAYSLETKLCKIDIVMEDVGIYLTSEDIDLGIINLDEYMYQETGWKFGYIDDKVKYDINPDGTKTYKLRWQESINISWHDFLTKNIQESFECIVMFDTFSKKVNLYHIDNFGDNLQLVLSFDNYIKTLVKEESTGDIVTRMNLVGNEEMDIVGATPTGYSYLEDYSYFINNGEMSDELTYAILKYQNMIAVRRKTWNDLISLKQEKQSKLIQLKTELFEVYETIKAYQSVKDRYNALKDTVNEAITIAEITKLNDTRVILEVNVGEVETDIDNLELEIHRINILCKRETATDEHGNLIFNDKLLDELKDFVYYDTYTNDSFLKVEDLISAGERELSFKCIPTYSYKIDVANFLKRVYMHPDRQAWRGQIGLGDIISIYNNSTGKEDLIYFVGYTQDIKSDNLSIELSNKKLKNNNFRNIADLLGTAKRSMETISSKRYLWNKQKYNRINLEQEVL